MKLLFITNDPTTARFADDAGVDRVMVDLEIIGKDARQGHLNTVISRHTRDDVSSLREVIFKGELMVRINPLFPGSKREIDDIVARGADRLMLPMFRYPDEVARVVDLIGGRVPLTLLVETSSALARLPSIASVDGIDDVHIGLNDLHLELRLDFMFELFPSGLLDLACDTLQKAGLPFGIGGIAKLDEGLVPAKLILSEHKRLGSTRVILSRSFYNPQKNRPEELRPEVMRLRQYLSSATPDIEANRKALSELVTEITAGKRF